MASLSATLSNEGLALGFFRVRPGAEVDVGKTLTGDLKGSRAYWCFGHYDLLRLHPLLSTDLPLYPSDPDIHQSVLLNGAAWAHPIQSPALADWPNDPLATVSLLKLNPLALRQAGLALELSALVHLDQSGLGHAFSSLGHSELIVFNHGHKLSDLLSRVSEVTTGWRVGDVWKSGDADLDDGNLFTKSFTIPMVSFDQVLRNGAWNLLPEEVQPTLRLSCQPGAERAVLGAMPPEWNAKAMHAYGRYDLLVSVRKQPLGHYLRGLLEFRSSVEPGTVYQTVTEFAGGECEADQHSNDPISNATAAVTVVRELTETAARSRVPANLRRALADFHARYVACDSNQYVSVEYRDMAGFIAFLNADLTLALDEYDSNVTSFHSRINRLEQLLVAASAALYQRYASVEAYLEGVSFPVFAPAIGYNRVIAAASALVSDVYNNGFYAGSNNRWPGFVAFAEAGCQHLQSDIFHLPVQDVMTPQAWGPLTHELGHGAEDALDLKVTSEETLKKYVPPPAATWSALDWGTMYDEIFAHTVDLLFFHAGWKGDELLRHLWQTWIDVPRVWLYKPYYLTRSLLVFALRSATAAQQATERDTRSDFLEELRKDMVAELIDATKERDPSHQFVNYIESVTPTAWKTIQEAAFQSGMDFLLDECFIKLKSADFEPIISAVNRDAGLAKAQAEKLRLGEIVLEELVNPLMVLKFLGHEPRSNLAAAMATIFSLSQYFRSRQEDMET